MKKLFLMIAVIVLISAGTVSAQGFYGRGSDNSSDRMPPAAGFQRGPGVVEVKNITGELVINDENDFPKIRAGREELTLMMPYSAVEDLKLKTGSKISVKGFEVPDRSWSVTGEKAFKVMELGYEGKTYMLGGGYGAFGGMMGGRWDNRDYMHDNYNRSYNNRMPGRR